MTSDEVMIGALAGILSGLAGGVEPAQEASHHVKNDRGSIHLPGAESIKKNALEQEISALKARIQTLELRANHGNPNLFPATPDEPRTPSIFMPESRFESMHRNSSSDSRARSGPKELQTTLISNLLSSHANCPSRNGNDQGLQLLQLTQGQAQFIENQFQVQEQEIYRLKEALDNVSVGLEQQKEHNELAIQKGFQENDALKRELVKHQQANTAFQKALREIGNIVVAVAGGDLSKKVLIHSIELDPEITSFKISINKMVDQLQGFASEVTRLARDVGTEGMLDRQVNLPGVRGIWAELTENVNLMAANLTDQVREIAQVTTAVAHGDLSRKVERPARGEILQLQQTINTMVEQLRMFATEVTRVAKNVGTEGILGEQAQVDGVQGMWDDLTVNVNAMANNLTNQVRDIAKVTKAVAKGDLTQKVSATCKGEILDLKSTINSMVDQLKNFSEEVSQLALDVGTEGKLGGQATVHGVEGTWRDLNQNVNVMAMKLTTQVREIAEVTTAVARGDLSRKVSADVRGEILTLKNTINEMVDRLGIFAFEVSKVAREVGTEGRLGGQAEVEHVEGKWKDLTDNVNTMAQVSLWRQAD